MYCPVCFNDTLKLASSGVVKMSFNGKSKATSQFFYNLKEENDAQIYEKLHSVVEDYFSWYENFQNKDEIKEVSLVSSDFKCTGGCGLGPHFSLSVVNLVVPKENVIKAVRQLADKHHLKLGRAFS